MKQTLPFLLLMLILSCSVEKINSSGIKIKSNYSIKIYNDISLTDKASVQGFVYSKYEKCFLEYANITIDKKDKIGVQSSKDGFFKCDINPGEYKIECFYVGTPAIETKPFKINKGQRAIIIFELGVDLIY